MVHYFEFYNHYNLVHVFYLNFQLIVEEISVEDSDLAQSPILRNIYELGEKSNKFIYECMKETQKVQMDSGKEQELF